MKKSHLTRSAVMCLLFLAPGLSHALITSLDLANYTYTATVGLNNSWSNEVSGITWNGDTNTLFMVGDQAQAIAQYSLGGAFINSMTMTGFSDGDAEGLTYIGSGQFVIAMETDFDAKLVDYAAGGIADGGAGGIPTVSIFSGTDSGFGFEGVTYDLSTGRYFFLEEKGSRTAGNTNPGSIYDTTLIFSPPSASAGPGISINATTDISGIQALSTVMAPGAADYDNLLIVSHENHLAMEVDRTTGNVLSQFSLSGIDFQSEGVTIDGNGIIYVVDEGPTSGTFGGSNCSGQNCPLLHIFTPTAVPPPPMIGVVPATYNGTDYQAYYDPVADLTWLASANVAGPMDWLGANTWAAGLDITGVTGWRLPDTVQPDSSCSNQGGGNSSGLNCTGSEMGNLFYNVLGGVAGQSITTTHNSNHVLFSGIQADNYWSATVYAPIPADAWVFLFADGTQLHNPQTNSYYAWAMHDGDVRALVDRDGDGLPDTVEDSNGNGVVNAGETDPLNPDSDDDGALDGQEDSNGNGIVDTGESNPLDFDSDDDGLTDGYEINISGTDPNSTTTLNLIPGDMNGDGEVNLGDLLLLQRQLLGY